MIAVDTNILVYAHVVRSPHHAAATEALRELHGAPAPWAVPWPCWHEFLAVVTNSRIYRPPSTTDHALAAARDLTQDAGVLALGESAEHPQIMDRLLRTSGVSGPKIHDARIAAICLGHGVSELWSADRDFSWFPELRVVNPLRGRG